MTRARLVDWALCDDTCDTAALVVSELVTNAIVHAAGERVVCELQDGDDSVRIAVHDEGCAPGEPHPSPQLPEEEHGRGLLLVEAMCRAWGAQPAGLGLLVWADVPRSLRTPHAPGSAVETTEHSGPVRGDGPEQRNVPKYVQAPEQAQAPDRVERRAEQGPQPAPPRDPEPAPRSEPTYDRHSAPRSEPTCDLGPAPRTEAAHHPVPARPPERPHIPRQAHHHPVPAPRPEPPRHPASAHRPEPLHRPEPVHGPRQAPGPERAPRSEQGSRPEQARHSDRAPRPEPSHRAENSARPLNSIPRAPRPADSGTTAARADLGWGAKKPLSEERGTGGQAPSAAAEPAFSARPRGRERGLV